jgi:predicted MPP superfamily phosphohydrolase
MVGLYALVALLHTYIGGRLLPDLPFGVVATSATALMLLASMLLVPLGIGARRFSRGPVAEGVTWAGLIALGFFSTLIVLTIGRDIAFLLTFAASRWLDPHWVDAFTAASAGVVPLAALVITAIGFLNARRRARVRDVRVPIQDLPEALRGFRIVQISDVHVGPTIKRPYLDAIVDAVNALDADMVAITGDLVDGSVRQLSAHTAPLARLASRHGTYFVTGNHEYYSGANAWVAELRRLGLNVLLNQHVVLDHDGVAVVVGGVTDYSAHHFDRTQASDPAAAIAGAPRDAGVKVLLAHQPRTAFAAAKAGFDLQLSGHTHGGQFVPWNFVVRLWEPFATGLDRLEKLWIYTSRGTGYWGPPKRFGAPSEITLVRLVPN